MTSYDQVISKFKTLRFGSIGDSIESVIKSAEDNDLSYLEYTEMLVDYELGRRNKNRIKLNMKKAGSRMRSIYLNLITGIKQQ